MSRAKVNLFTDDDTVVTGHVQTLPPIGQVTINVDIDDECVLFLNEKSANAVRNAITKVLRQVNTHREKGRTVSNYKAS